MACALAKNSGDLDTSKVYLIYKHSTFSFKILMDFCVSILCYAPSNGTSLHCLQKENLEKAWLLLAAGQKVYLSLLSYNQCHEFHNRLALVVPGPA